MPCAEVTSRDRSALRRLQIGGLPSRDCHRDPRDTERVHFDMHALSEVAQPDANGIPTITSCAGMGKNVPFLMMVPNANYAEAGHRGAEFLILTGDVRENTNKLSADGWLRAPEEGGQVQAGGNGSRIWLRTNHLVNGGHRLLAWIRYRLTFEDH